MIPQNGWCVARTVGGWSHENHLVQVKSFSRTPEWVARLNYKAAFWGGYEFRCGFDYSTLPQAALSRSLSRFGAEPGQASTRRADIPGA